MSDLIAVADAAWRTRYFLHMNLSEICSALEESACPEFVEILNALNEHMPLSEDGKDWGGGTADLTDPVIREYAGAYEMCALLLTSPVFDKNGRAVIEQQAHRMKDKLEALGVKFTDGASVSA